MPAVLMEPVRTLSRMAMAQVPQRSLHVVEWASLAAVGKETALTNAPGRAPARPTSWTARG